VIACAVRGNCPPAKRAHGAQSGAIRYAVIPQPRRTEPIVNEQEPILWRTCPALQQPGRAVLAVAIIAFLSVLAAVVGGHLLWGGGFGLILFLTQSRFYLPTSYELAADKLVVQHAGATSTLKPADVIGGDVGRLRAVLRVRSGGRRRFQVVLFSDAVRAEAAGIIERWLSAAREGSAVASEPPRVRRHGAAEVVA